MALRRCNALRNAALLALRWYMDTMPQAPLLRCFNHFFSRSRGPLLPARICHTWVFTMRCHPGWHLGCKMKSKWVSEIRGHLELFLGRKYRPPKKIAVQKIRRKNARYKNWTRQKPTELKKIESVTARQKRLVIKTSNPQFDQVKW